MANVGFVKKDTGDLIHMNKKHLVIGNANRNKQQKNNFKKNNQYCDQNTLQTKNFQKNN